MAAAENRDEKTPKSGCRRDWLRPQLLIRYTLLQLPGTLLLLLVVLGIRRWWDFPVWAAVVAVAMWVAKDVLLYPFIWRAYDWDRMSDNFTMLQRVGTVVERLDPSGYVRVRGELWKATVEDDAAALEPGREVTVIRVDGLRLIVRARR